MFIKVFNNYWMYILFCFYIAEIHRALELLGDYHAALVKTSEKLLSIEIERIMRVLKSRFFQALIGKYHSIILFLVSV